MLKVGGMTESCLCVQLYMYYTSSNEWILYQCLFLYYAV